MYPAGTVQFITGIVKKDDRFIMLIDIDMVFSIDEIDFLAIAIQGIADSIFDQKRQGMLSQNSSILSNTIIDYSLRLIGYPKQEIEAAIKEADDYIKAKHITIDKYFEF